MVPDQLKQVFLNLLLNATESMAEQGGALQISTALGQGQFHNGQTLPIVHLKFSDTGRGIAAESVPNIFEPFFSTKQTGLGMGLSIARAIVDAYGGGISATPGAENGTTFLLQLPSGVHDSQSEVEAVDKA